RGGKTRASAPAVPHCAALRRTSKSENGPRCPASRARRHRGAALTTVPLARPPSRGTQAARYPTAARVHGQTRGMLFRTPRKTADLLQHGRLNENECSSGRRLHPESHRSRRVPNRALVPATPGLREDAAYEGVSYPPKRPLVRD